MASFSLAVTTVSIQSKAKKVARREKPLRGTGRVKQKEETAAELSSHRMRETKSYQK